MVTPDYRAEKSGFAREVQEKLAGKFDGAEAGKALKWLALLKPKTTVPDNVRDALAKIPTDISSVQPDDFYKYLFDGLVLGHTMAALHPQAVNFSVKAWQSSPSQAFEASRQRERIGIFLKFAVDFGVSSACLFQTDQLYEKTNLCQVLICLSQLGTEAQSKPDYDGPQGMWMHKHQQNPREFTEEQLRAGEGVIGLQMGTNKGANASGMSFGSHRFINDSH
jgi:transgelin